MFPIQFSVYWPDAFAMAFESAKKTGYRYVVMSGTIGGTPVWIVGRHRRQMWRRNDA